MASRRKRLERPAPQFSFGRLDRDAVVAVARLGCCTATQLMGFLGWTYTQANRHLLNAWAHGYLDKRTVTRSQLAEKADPQNVYGSAPDIFVLEALGRKEAAALLADHEVSDTPEIHDKSFGVAHHLMLRDVRVWLEKVARSYPSHPGLLDWRFERQAKVLNLIPDAWFRYGLPDREFGMFLEADRGTESLGKWEAKVAAYAPLLAQEGEGSPVWQATGMAKARVMVVAPEPARRDYLWKVTERVAPLHGIRAGRFLFAEAHVLGFTDLAEPAWRADGMEGAVPLVKGELL